MLQFCLAQGEPAAIRFDPLLKRLTLAWPADEDAVAGVGPAEEGDTPRVVVRLLKRPTLLYLALLREAMSSRREVAVAIFPGGGEIDDVRLMPKR